MNAPTESPDAPSREFAHLVREELGLPDDSVASGKRWLNVPPRQLFGLALSGGGIRSATFNLGLLQGLHELGFLRGFDYLATVSGGGYAGSFWSRWRAGNLTRDNVFPEREPGADGEPAELGHLRRFSRFLSPSLGVFSFDTGRMVVALFNAIVPSFLGSLSFLLLVVLMAIGIAGFVLVLPAPLARFMPGDGALAIGAAAFVSMFIFGVLHLLAMRSLWREELRLKPALGIGLGTTLALSLFWSAMVGLMPEMPAGALATYRYLGECGTTCAAGTLLDGGRWAFAFAPAAALLLLPTIAAVLRLFDGGIEGRPRAATALVDQINSWYMFAAAAWIGLTLLWYVAFALFAWRRSPQEAIAAISLFGIPLATLVTWLSRFVGRVGQSSESKGQRVGRLLVGFGGYIVVALMTIACMLLFIAVHNHGWWIPLLLAMGLGIAYVLLLYDPNRVGLHEFYRSRIARAYLGAARSAGDASSNATDEQWEDDIVVSELPTAATNEGPLHLVVCAANNLTPRDRLGSLSRGATSAVVSPVALTVGDRWALWPHNPDRRPRRSGRIPPARSAPWLSAAVTASGAAFNTQMGSKSKLLGPAIAFVMSSLGLRLGLWLHHPDHLRPGQPIVRTKRGFALVAELLGHSDATRDEWVFLSDGGHFDNTGLYELVRRHCRFILVSDCGADSERVFDDLGGAVRRVREDFGVDIKINLEALKPAANGMSRQPMVAGDIHYPDGDTGTLLVLKPSLIGNEPPDILQYRARNEKFPHQSTSDQFFDEAQWESYRRLGLHVARTAFASAGERHPTLATGAGVKPQQESIEALRRRMARDFGAARREWLARPADYVERVNRTATIVASLERRLAEAGAELPKEIFWEVPRSVDSASARRGMNTEEQLRAIATLRQALVAFESIFLSEGLATAFNQPMYTGVMNLMARWLSAPLTRAWWPLLKATVGVAFRQFAEKQFGVGATDGRRLHLTDRTSGTHLELASRHRDLRRNDGRTLTSLRLVLTLDSTHTIEVARLDADGTGDRDILMWDARDLYVPPGLWGMGLGSELLRQAGTPIEVATEDERVCSDWVHRCRKVVFVRSFWSGTPDEKKDAADLQQLYLDSGFTSASARLFQDGTMRDVYAEFHARWKAESPYLLEPAAIARHVDCSDFVVLYR